MILSGHVNVKEEEESFLIGDDEEIISESFFWPKNVPRMKLISPLFGFFSYLLSSRKKVHTLQINRRGKRNDEARTFYLSLFCHHARCVWSESVKKVLLISVLEIKAMVEI